MSYDKENIFAKILRGEIPCDKIYEDEYVLSFKDIRPQAPSHALVIPKGEYIDINDFSACLLYTSPSPRDGQISRMPSSA